jgi:HEAT repeat protein
VSERSIEVPDPEPPPAVPGVNGASPYKNLLVPLVVVPFMVVGVLVLVFVFFGAITGHESSLEENLDRVVRGGANESKQAAMNLAQQALDNSVARNEGKPAPWPVPPDFLAKLQAAWTDIPADEKHNSIRLALAQLSAQYGDPEAFDKLSYFVHLPAEQDADGQLRLYAIFALTWLGDDRARDLVIPFLQDPDPYLRQNAAAALQKLPGEATLAALRKLLDDPSLELRGQAAISLSHLGDASGAQVLIELLDPASYARAHEREPKKYASEKVIQESRRKALDALARLERADDRAVFERLARDDADPLIREGAMRALQTR